MCCKNNNYLVICEENSNTNTVLTTNKTFILAASFLQNFLYYLAKLIEIWNMPVRAFTLLL